MKFAIIVTLILLTFPGCGTTYSKPGANEADFYRDHNDCQVKAQLAGYSGYDGKDFSSGYSRSRFIKQCLMGQGWTKE